LAGEFGQQFNNPNMFRESSLLQRKQQGQAPATTQHDPFMMNKRLQKQGKKQGDKKAQMMN